MKNYYVLRLNGRKTEKTERKKGRKKESLILNLNITISLTVC